MVAVAAVVVVVDFSVLFIGFASIPLMHVELARVRSAAPALFELD